MKFRKKPVAIEPDYREKARAVCLMPIHRHGNDDAGCHQCKSIAAAMKEVAEEAQGGPHLRAVLAETECEAAALAIADLEDKLAAFTSATPDSLEVKEALASTNGRCQDCPPEPCKNYQHRQGRILARALLSALVESKSQQDDAIKWFALYEKAQVKIKELADDRKQIVESAAFNEELFAALVKKNVEYESSLSAALARLAEAEANFKRSEDERIEWVKRGEAAEEKLAVMEKYCSDASHSWADGHCRDCGKEQDPGVVLFLQSRCEVATLTAARDQAIQEIGAWSRRAGELEAALGRAREALRQPCPCHKGIYRTDGNDAHLGGCHQGAALASLPTPPAPEGEKP